MNILYLTDTGDIVGGGEISLLNLLERIDRSRFSPFLAVPFKGELTAQAEFMHVPVSVIPVRKISNPLYGLQTLYALFRLTRILKQKEIHLIHTNSTGGIVALAGIAARLAGIPFVSHVRIMDSGRVSDIAQSILSTRVIAISRACQARFLELPWRGKVEMIYNAVDCDRFASVTNGSQIRKEAHCDFGEPLVGMVASYYQNKGLEYFIAAAGQVAARVPGARFVIIGLDKARHGGYIDHLRGLAARAGLGEKLTIAARKKDMPQVMAGLDVFVFSTLRESFGRVAVEAMASGKPVVAFATGGVAEIVDDGRTGYLVAPRDVSGMAEKIVYLLQHRETREEFGRQAALRARNAFGITGHVRSVQDVYGRLKAAHIVGPEECSLCAGALFRRINTCIITPEDARIKEKQLHLVRCRRCGLVFVHPLPDVFSEHPEQLYGKDYFEAQYMRFYGEAASGGLQSNEPFASRLALLNEYAVARQGGRRLLDVGCANGTFLLDARRQGWTVTGIDLSDQAVQACARQGVPVRRGALEELYFPDASFDAVVCSDSLEHVVDPKVFLREARRVLDTDGVLYLALPDFNGLQYRLLRLINIFNRRNYFVLPHHVFHFTRRSLRYLLEESGFEIRREISSESAISQKGWARWVMRSLFCIARLLRMRDRLVVIAVKGRRKIHYVR